MLQMIALMIYGGAMVLAIVVMAGMVRDHSGEMHRALFGDVAPAAPRARLVARARRVRSLAIRPRVQAERRRAA